MKKENKYNEKYFYESVNKNSYKDMFNFLKGHYQYFTMNSWNKLESIANNVKLYNLKLNGNYWNLLDMLQVDNYFTINTMIKDWEMEHKGYSVGFNGRSGGYLVLYNEDNNRNILDNFILGNDTYNEFKEDVRNEYNYGSLKNYKDKLIQQVEIVQSFDKLCDDIRNQCQYMLDNCTIKEEQVEYTDIRTERTLEWE